MRDAGKPDIALADEAIDGLRSQVRSLLGLIDTARRPEPNGIVPPSARNPGAVWKPAPKWSVRAIDEDGCDDAVFVSTPQHWGGDFTAVPLDEARALAMSLLAACEWAEKREPADRRRYPELDEDDTPTGRMFICGPMS